MGRSLRYAILPVLFVCVVVLCHPAPAAAQEIDESFKADIRKMLEVTGSAKIATQMATMMSSFALDELRKKQPGIPEHSLQAAKEIFESEYAKAFNGPDSPIELSVPVYAKHFTHDEIRSLLAFYNTDLGKKMIATMPVILQDVSGIAQQWAERYMPKFVAAVETRLREQGLIK